MRQTAWLNAKPEKQKLTRLQRYKLDEEEGIISPFLQLPEETQIHYLFNCLIEMGPVTSGEMGEMPVTWAELKAWSEVSNTFLDSWEVQTLKRLSNEYVYQLNISSDPAMGPPWQAEAVLEIPEQTHARIDSKLKSLPRSLFAK